MFWLVEELDNAYIYKVQPQYFPNTAGLAVRVVLNEQGIVHGSAVREEKGVMQDAVGMFYVSLDIQTRTAERTT